MDRIIYSNNNGSIKNHANSYMPHAHLSDTRHDGMGYDESSNISVAMKYELDLDKM